MKTNRQVAMSAMRDEEAALRARGARLAERFARHRSAARVQRGGWSGKRTPASWQIVRQLAAPRRGGVLDQGA
jgi:hypothetical protein